MRKLLLLVAAVGALAVPSTALAASPYHRSGAINVTSTGTYFTADATNSNATDRKTFCGSSVNTHEVWFTWTAPADGTASVDTFGSNYDTVLTVFADRTEVDCNDDTPTTLQSLVTFQAVAGTTYYFEVAVYSTGGPGMAQLEVTMT
jgi:hypothetical protein